jgi:hypothetical protein
LLTEDGLIARQDYDVEISGGLGGAHYVSDYIEVAGIKVPTKRRVFPRNPTAAPPLSHSSSRST